MAISAADVKRLRDETDAPMMECKAALEEAGGDFEKAKAILREKGKAAAGKRAGRSTSADVVAIARSSNHHAIGAVVLECETDFVARNEEFVVVVPDGSIRLKVLRFRPNREGTDGSVAIGIDAPRDWEVLR